MNNHNREAGMTNPLLIASIILGLFAALFAGGFIWAYGEAQKYKNNSDSLVATAVTTAKKQQADEDQKQYLEQAKQPYKQLVSPDDYGRVSISYPKTWSVYVANGGKGGYEAYLNPDTVPSVTTMQPYAARLVIVNQKYETAVAAYDGLVKKGDLKSTPVMVNNFNGVRLDGKFSTTRSGSAVFFKVRDKTLMIATDIDSFKGDFDNVIIKSLDFNP